MSPRTALQKLTEYSFYSLFFVTPFILTTVNFELFEFPKMLFVYALTVVIVGSWLGRSLIEGRFTLRQSFFLWPLGLFLLSQASSTIFSIDLHTSLWGYYSRFHGGLISTFCYVSLFLIFVSTATKRQVKASLVAIVAAATFISLYAVAEHFGIDAAYWVQDVRNRVYSTLGQPNWLAAWLVALIPLLLAYFLKPPKNSWPTALAVAILTTVTAYGTNRLLTGQALPLNFGAASLFLIFFAAGLYLAIWISNRSASRQPLLNLLSLYVLICLFTLAVLYTKSRSGILALVVSYGFFWLLLFSNSKITKTLIRKFVILSLTFAALFLTVGTEWTPSIKQMINEQWLMTKNKEISHQSSIINHQSKYHISKSTDIRKAVWEGGLRVFQHWPIFGSGVETFAYSYYNYRVRSHNDTSEWDFLYNKAHNEYLNFLATTGLAGTIAVFSLTTFYLAFSLAKLVRKKPAVSVLLAAPLLLLFSPKFSEELIIYPPILVPLGIALGIAGLITFAVIKVEKARFLSLTYLQIALISGYLTIIITNFYGFSVVTVALLFFLYPAFSAVLYEKKRFGQWRFAKEISMWEKLTFWYWLGLAFISLFTLYSLLFIYNYWRSDKIFNLGKNLVDTGNVLTGIQELSTATNLRPNEALYHMELAEAEATAAYAYHTQEASLSATLVEQFTNQAETETKTALSLNQVHLNFYKSAAKVYLVLAQINPQKFLPQALATLEMATRLSPTDPKLTLNLGLLYQQLGEKDTTLNYLKKTVELKPDYRQAWMYLAGFYEEQKQIKEAQAAYQYILEHIDPGDLGAKEALKKITND